MAEVSFSSDSTFSGETDIYDSQPLGSSSPLLKFDANTTLEAASLTDVYDLPLHVQPLRSSTPLPDSEERDFSCEVDTNNTDSMDCELMYNKWPSTDYSDCESCLSENVGILEEVHMHMNWIALSFIIICLAFTCLRY